MLIVGGWSLGLGFGGLNLNTKPSARVGSRCWDALRLVVGAWVALGAVETLWVQGFEA